MSSALGMTDNIIESRYHPASWNIYIFQCSDGDNWPTDNQKTTDLANRLLDKIQFFGYCQIEPNTERASHLNHGSLQAVYQSLIGQKFKTAEVGSKEHIWPAFRAFFGNDL